MKFIVFDNENIIGCYEEKINAIIFMLDCIINKYQTYLDFLKLNGANLISPNLNNFKIISIIDNSNIVKNGR